MQFYLCAYSAIYVCAVHFVRTMLCMWLYFEPFSVNISNKGHFMLQIRNFSTRVYVFFILLWLVLALYLQCSVVKAKIFKTKNFQIFFHWWGRVRVSDWVVEKGGWGGLRIAYFACELTLKEFWVPVTRIKHNVLMWLVFIWAVGMQWWGTWVKVC